MSGKVRLMIDFIKCRILNPSRLILAMDYYVLINPKTGKPKESIYEDPQGGFVNKTVTYIYEVRGLIFQKKIVEKTFPNGGVKNFEYYELRGSLHQYKNYGEYNFNRFTFHELVSVISEISIKYHLDPEQMKIIKMEFGLNVYLPITAKSYINSIKCYKRKPFSIDTFKGQGLMIVFDLNEYALKCYDKGVQNQKRYNTPKNLFRTEVDTIKKGFINSFGIYTLADLLVKDNIRKLGVQLLIVHEQQIILSGLKKGKTPKRNTMIANMRNRDFWKDTSNDQFKRYKTYLHNPDFDSRPNLSNEVYQILKTEIECVLNEPKKHPRFDHLEKNQNTPVLNTSIEGKYKGETLQQCLITGKDISDQKKGSKFMSEKNIGYKLAHDVRNADSNPRNNLKRRILKPIAKNQNSLFQVFDYLELNKEQQEVAGNISFDNQKESLF